VLCAAVERWTNELRSRSLDAVGDALWLERVELVCAEPSVPPEPAAADDDAIALLQGHARAAAASDEELARLAAELDELGKKLPPEVAAEGLRLEDPDTLRRLLAEAVSLVEGRLARGVVP